MIFRGTWTVAGLLLVWATTTMSAAPRTGDVLEYLNQVRSQAGMTGFAHHPLLEQAAQQHADYLVINRAQGHRQVPGRPGFTGVQPADRMLASGYSHRHGSENVSTHQGDATAEQSVVGLMAAIYHRLAFLSFDYDQAGIGLTSQGRYHSFVYKMGNSAKDRLCQQAYQPEAGSSYIYQVCNEADRRLDPQAFDNAVRQVRLKNPAVVVWPPAGAEAITPGFYDEAPDPLPGMHVSGYPVSIQFNPAIHAVPPRLLSFELYRMPDRQPVKLAARLDQDSDRHRKFSAYDHAIFPYQRLQYASHYRAEAEYMLPDNTRHRLSWDFNTTSFTHPLVRVMGGERIAIGNSPLVIYAPPQSVLDGVAEYTLRFRGFDEIDVTLYDPHTMIVTADGPRGEALFDFHGRQFQVYRH